jgi:hypothetical protein
VLFLGVSIFVPPDPLLSTIPALPVVVVVLVVSILFGWVYPVDAAVSGALSELPAQAVNKPNVVMDAINIILFFMS